VLRSFSALALTAVAIMILPLISRPLDVTLTVTKLPSRRSVEIAQQRSSPAGHGRFDIRFWRTPRP